MCLGIPGRVVEIRADVPDLATIDVGGALRQINLGLLDDGDVEVGGWVLVHMGFALSAIDEHEARDAMAVLRTLGPDGAE